MGTNSNTVFEYSIQQQTNTCKDNNNNDRCITLLKNNIEIDYCGASGWLVSLILTTVFLF